MLCYAVWDSSHQFCYTVSRSSLQALTHDLAQVTSCSAAPSSAAHFKLFPYCLAWLLSCLAHTA